MTVALEELDDKAREWHRLNDIALKYEGRMRHAYTRAALNGVQIDALQLKKVVIDILVEVCVTSAEVYGVVFNPASPIYSETVDELVEKFIRTIYSPRAREAVRQILPSGLSLADLNRRLNTFGLTPQQAVSVERYRQELLNSGAKSVEPSVERVRRSEIQTRGNLVSNTEVNRIVNTALETLFIDNSRQSVVITKARNVVVKRVVTRRDNRVCNYCAPLDGIKVGLGAEFDTDYGFYQSPPFHPMCRCFMVIETPGGQLFRARKKGRT